MAERWTDAQRRAFELRGRDLLVSAGAGAGKTAVLVERVLRRILDPRDPGDVDRLLVVTFTEAAAAELRARIAAALEQAVARSPGDQRPRRQLSLLPRAAIWTLHAFCLQTVRQYFYRLDLDPALRVLGEQEAALLRQEVLEEVFEARYAVEDAAFLALVDAYSDAALQELTLRLHAAAYSQPEPERWLQGLAGRFAIEPGAAVDGTGWAAPVRAAARRVVARAVAQLDQALALCALPGGPEAMAATLETDRGRLAALLEALDGGSWDELGPALAAADTWAALRGGRGGNPDLDAEARQLRDHAKADLRSLQEGIFRPGAELLAELRGFLPQAHALVDLVRGFDASFAAAKLGRASLDFGDMERYALRLLRDGDAGEGTPAPSAAALELRRRFDEVLVDEYQDINPLQDAVLALVASPGRSFRVGDVKQSIYRFRQAEPGLFLGRLEQAARAEAGPGSGDSRDEGGGEVRIDLSDNFRSRPCVVDAVNFVFRQVMTPGLGRLRYDAEAELVARAPYPRAPADAPVEVHLLERGGAEGETAESTALEREAALAARRIGELLAEAPPVWDPEEGRMRELRPRDVVVLLRAARTQLPVFAEALAAVGLPVHARSTGGFFSAMEVEIVLALLQLIDNPLQDIPLAAVLRSPLVGLSPEEMARVRLAAPGGAYLDAVRAAATDGPEPLAGRLSAFLTDLDGWRTAARRGSVSRLVDRLYAETGWLTHASALPGGEQRRANLLALADRARQFDGFARQGLFRFLRFVERLREEGDDLGAPPAAGERDDVVRLMTVHQSKGLEFPVVVLANLGGQFTFEQGDVLLDRRLGLGPVLVDPELRVAHPSLAHRAVREQARREGLEEEARTLYVAMTRARERLLLFGSVRDVPRTARRWMAEARAAGDGSGLGQGLPETTLADAGCFLDWLGPALMLHPDCAELRELAGAAGAWRAGAAGAPRWPLQNASGTGTDPTGGMQLRSTATSGGGWPCEGGPSQRPPSGHGSREGSRERWGEAPPAAGPATEDASRWEVHLWSAEDAFRVAADTDDAAHADAAAGADSAAVAADAVTDADSAAVAAVAGAAADPVDDAAGPHARTAAPPGLPPTLWIRMAAGDPLGGGPDVSPLGRDLAERLLGGPRRRALAAHLAKRSVTELRARPDPAAAEAPTPSELRIALPERPRFLQPPGRGRDPAAAGTATHVVLQHLDLGRSLDEEDIAAQVAALVAAEHLTTEQRDAVDAASLARFFATPLGRRLRAGRAAARREWMFSLGLPAARIYPDLPPEAAAGEVVLVQGVVDCLVEEPDGCWLIDFKTDWLRGRSAADAAEDHRQQLELYGTAVETILGRPVRELYVCFLETGESVGLRGGGGRQCPPGRA